MQTILKNLGIDGDFEIVVPDNPDIVEITAAQELRSFLEKAAITIGIVPESQSKGDKRFFLGRTSSLRFIRKLDDDGPLQIGEVSPEDDGFHLKQIGQDYIVAGANPRGVLYGVYTFEDFLNDGAVNVLDIKKVPYYRKRSSALGYYHNRYTKILEDDHFDEKIAYLSRLGMNQWTSYDGFDFTLNKLVQSDIFPFQTPPVSEYQGIVRLISSICKKYGIDYYLQLWEPILPRLAGDLEKYPEEALGLVSRPWGDPKVDKTLCINSTIVQDHYRNMMKKLVREFPDVRGVFFYNMDGSTWMCTPELCERCKIACKDSPPGEYNPWESQALLINVLAKAAHEDKPDFDFRFWGLHYHGERFEKKLMGAVQEYNSVAGNWNGSDRDIMIPDQAEPDPVFVLAQKAAKERAIPQYAFFQFNNFESIPRSFPFPFHVCDSLKKFKNWGLKNIMEDAGSAPGTDNSINALVMKEFEGNPDQDPQEFLAALSVRQFGQSAGKLMVQAWQELEKALDVWNDMLDNPLSGSHFATSIGANDGLPRPILPGIEKSYRNFWEVLSAVEPHKAELNKKFSEPGFLVKMKSMCSSLVRASAYASQAVAAASDKEFIGICYYEPVDGRPSCRQYAELNWAPIAVAAQICQQRCNMLSAVFLLTDLQKARELGDEAQAIEKQYSELIRSDLIVQERFGELLMSFAEMRPSYARTGLKDNEIADLLLSTRAKIDLLRRSIASGKYLVFEDMPKNERYHFCWA